MKYQVNGGGWPIGAYLVPSGTIIDNPDSKPEDQLTPWERLAKGRIPPRDAIALDDEAYGVMVQHHEIGPRPVWRVHRR